MKGYENIETIKFKSLRVCTNKHNLLGLFNRNIEFIMNIIIYYTLIIY